MSSLFSQTEFRGGLDAEFDALKIPAESYPLLINGRVRDGNISPVRQHALDSNRPLGNWQGAAIVGDYVVAIVSGVAHFKNLATNSNWNVLPNWTALDDDVEDVYIKPVPISVFQMNRSGTANNTIETYNPNIAPTRQALYVSDGINQGRIIFANLSSRNLKTFAEWSTDIPEYVPIGIMPAVGNNKLALVSPDRKQILQSVTGRYLDFVINITSDGDKGGDAYTQAYAVDFNDLTALFPIADGGWLATTLYATYLLLPTGQFIFGEPVLRAGEPIPVGAVNEKSFVDIIGDTAFISQAGIQSLNVVSQIRNESNNTPLSAKISQYLIDPYTHRAITQTDTAAINFDDYALFSMNTTFGRVVIVYDTVRRQFVSFDTGFGTVKQFLVYRTRGVTRLFFFNTDGEFYEAYASENFNVCRVRLGDYSAGDSRTNHKIDRILALYTDVTESTPVRLSYYSDQALVGSVEQTLEHTTIKPAAPAIVPFVSSKETTPVIFGGKGVEGYKSAVWLEWAGDASLTGIHFEGSSVPATTSGDPIIQTETSPIVFTSDLGVHGVAATASGGDLVEGVLTVGNVYYIRGSVNMGDRIYSNEIFTAKMDSAYLDGVLYNVTTFRQLFQQMRAERPALFLTGGNSISGGDPGYLRFKAVTYPETVFGAAGNLELDTGAGEPWYQRHERYGIISTEFVDFFILSGGWTSAEDSPDANGNPGSTIEPDGVTGSSAQAFWLQTRLGLSDKPFKVGIVHYPPYTDGSDSPGFAPLRWDFRKMGLDLLVSGHTRAYERFYIEGFPYINCGLGGMGLETTWNTQRAVTRYADSAGYLIFKPSRFSLDVIFKDINGVQHDATTIYSR